MCANSIAAAHFGLHVGEMTALDATSVATLLCEFGQRSALRGENPFRAKAYARAAEFACAQPST